MGTRNTYSVLVDYNLTMDEAVRAGNYDCVDPDMRFALFSSTRKGIVNVDLILAYYDCHMESQKILEDFDRWELRAAEASEILALGAAHPEVQREFPIVGLGSVWLDRNCNGVVPALRLLSHGGSEQRSLLLPCFAGRWAPGCRFAAVRK